MVPHKDLQHALKVILPRHESLGIRPIDFEVIPYVGKADPGCYRQSHIFLRERQREFQHAREKVLRGKPKGVGALQ